MLAVLRVGGIREETNMKYSIAVLVFTILGVAHGADYPYHAQRFKAWDYWVIVSSGDIIDNQMTFRYEEVARDWAEALNDAHEQRVAREEAKKNSDEHLSEGAKKRGCIFDGCNTCCPIKGVNAMDCTAVYCGPTYFGVVDPKSVGINADDDVDWQ